MDIELHQTVFVDRMIECLGGGDRTNKKLVERIFDALSHGGTAQMEFYSAQQLAKYKQHAFAKECKQHCGLPIGVDTILFAKMKRFTAVD